MAKDVNSGRLPDHALQRTAAGRRGCNRRASSIIGSSPATEDRWPASLSLGRWAAMRVALTFTLFISAVCFFGCQPHTRSASVAPMPSGATPDLEHRVNQRVVLEGIVSNSKCPQVQGVDVWGLEDYRGQRV